MPLQNTKPKSSKTFIHIYNGKFSRRVEPSTEGAAERLNKASKPVWELYYNAYEGNLKDVEVRTHEKFGQSLNVHFDDCTISLPMNSGHARDFLKRIPNVNPEEPVAIRLHDFADKEKPDKQIRGLNIYQGGAKVDIAYGKDSLPPWKKVMFNGQPAWDRSEQDNMLLAGLAQWKKDTGLGAEPTAGLMDVPEDDEAPF